MQIWKQFVTFWTTVLWPAIVNQRDLYVQDCVSVTIGKSWDRSYLCSMAPASAEALRRNEEVERQWTREGGIR